MHPDLHDAAGGCRHRRHAAQILAEFSPPHIAIRLSGRCSGQLGLITSRGLLRLLLLAVLREADELRPSKKPEADDSLCLQLEDSK